MFGVFLLILVALSGLLYWVSGKPPVDFQRAPDGYDQFMLFLRLNNYELKAASVFILAYVAVCLLNRFTSRRLSYSAVFSSLNLVLTVNRQKRGSRWSGCAGCMGMVLIIFGVFWILLALFFVAALACSAKRDPADLEWEEPTEAEDKSVFQDWGERALSA